MCILQSCNECRYQLLRLTISDDIVRKLVPLDNSSDPNTRALNLRYEAFRFNFQPLWSTEWHCKGQYKRSSYRHIQAWVTLWSWVKCRRIDCVWPCFHIKVRWDGFLYFFPRTFAISLCPILCDLLKKVTTTTDDKLKLIPLGEYAYHDMAFLPEVCSLPLHIRLIDARLLEGSS